MAEEGLVPIPKSGVLVNAEKYIQRAQGGEKVTRDERRHALNYIDGMYPNQYSNRQLAAIFQVDEGTIRHDRRQIRKQNAENIREDTDVKLIINDLLESRDRALTQIARAMAAMEREGRTTNNTYLAFLKAGPEMHLKITTALQDMGLLPKTLGTVTVNKRVFKAIVDQRNGSVSEVRPLDLFDDMREGESLEDLLRRKAQEQKEEIQDAEFVTLPALPPGDNAESEEQIEEPAPDLEGSTEA